MIDSPCAAARPERRWRPSVSVWIVATTALAALSGCGAAPEASSATESAVVSLSPSATPTPAATAMSVPEAGKLYLAAVCPANMLADNATVIVQTAPLDLETAKSAAAALRDGHRKVIETLSDPKVLWPDAVKADVATLAEATYGEVSGADSVAKQTTGANLIAAWNAWISSPTIASTAQKIRLKLNLAPDTSSSCKPK